MQRKLTDSYVARTPAPAQGQVDVFDIGYPALALRIGKRERTFTFHYRTNGKLKRITLGRYPEMTLAEAREAWRLARKALAEGREPDQRGRRHHVPVMATELVLEQWLKAWRIGKAANTIKAVDRQLKHDVIPAWQGRSIDSLAKRDVLDLLDGVVERGAVVQARRIFATLQTFFGWCSQRDILTTSPMAGLKRPGSETSRERVLSDDELVKVLGNAGDYDPFTAALHLLALTGARREEIGQLKWSEIEGDSIKLDSSRTKSGKPHSIPLSSAARAILKSVPHIADCDFVFSADGRTPVKSWHHAKNRIDAASGVADWTVHDLRRTVATGLQKLGVNLQVIEAVLGHANGGSRSGVVGVYQRHQFDSEKRAALEAWGAHVIALLEGGERGKVLPISRNH
jgi:integrase